MSTKGRYGNSRRELAEVAIRRFQQHGFEATTVDDIATAAGYTARTFFRQFASKEDVVFFDWPDILSPLQDLVSSRPPSVWDAVSEIIVTNSDEWVAAGPALALSRTRLIHDEPALYRRYLELCSEWERVIVDVFAAEAEVDPVTDARSQVIATSIMGACRVALRQWSRDPATRLRDHASAGLRIIESGLRPQQP